MGYLSKPNSSLSGVYEKIPQKCQPQTKLVGYQLYKDFASNGSDIIKHDIPVWQLATKCNENANCVGFSSDGYLKSKLVSCDTMSGLGYSSDPRRGIYTKIQAKACTSPSTVAGYRFYANKASPGDLLYHKPELSGKFAELKATCDADLKCAGFLTNGRFRTNIKNCNELTSGELLPGGDRAGTYEKVWFG
jgi:hypothetical protein